MFLFYRFPHRMAEVDEITPAGAAQLAAQSPWRDDKYRVVFVSGGVFMN
jgi:hypothetical protein